MAFRKVYHLIKEIRQVVRNPRMESLKRLAEHVSKNTKWFAGNTRSNTHYETLKISRTATNQEIREAFLKLSKELHPDKHPNNPNSQENFIKINEAYSVLSKDETKRIYDNQLNQFTTDTNYQRSWQTFESYWATYRIQISPTAGRILFPLIAIVFLIAIFQIFLVLLKLAFFLFILFYGTKVLTKRRWKK